MCVCVCVCVVVDRYFGCSFFRILFWFLYLSFFWLNPLPIFLDTYYINLFSLQIVLLWRKTIRYVPFLVLFLCVSQNIAHSWILMFSVIFVFVWKFRVSFCMRKNTFACRCYETSFSDPILLKIYNLVLFSEASGEWINLAYLYEKWNLNVIIKLVIKW